MFLFVCNIYLPANAQLTLTQQEKRVAGISFLEVPDVIMNFKYIMIGELSEPEKF